MTGDGGLVEVQATAERTPLSRAHLDDLLALAAGGHRASCAACRTRARRRCGREACVARHPQRPQGARVRRAARAARARCRCPTTSSCRPRTGETFAEQRARQGARRRGGHRPARRSPTTRASRPRRSAARPGVRSARYAGEHATDEENLAKLLREAPAGSALAYVCALAYVDAATATSTWSRAAATGTLAAEPRGERRLRLRPGVRARRRAPTAARWPSSRRRRRTRSATAAARRARCCRWLSAD